jgi:hypothetical protein
MEQPPNDPPKKEDDEVKKDMYEDPRRNQKLTKPLTWEEIVDQQWAAQDAGVSSKLSRYLI